MLAHVAKDKMTMALMATKQQQEQTLTRVLITMATKQQQEQTLTWVLITRFTVDT